MRSGSGHPPKKLFIVVAALVVTGILCSGCQSELLGANFPPLTVAGSENGDLASHGLVATEELVIALLFLAALIGVLTQYLKIPYTVGLVIVGLGLTLFGNITVSSFSPELILTLLVPPLVFEAAFHLDWRELRHNMFSVLLLAVPGVALTTFLVGGLVSWLAKIPFPTALVFGALIAATDPVAVVALFRTLGAPKKLQTLLEGESLLNDGTAIVLFNVILAYALSNQINLMQGVREFFTVALGGVVIGGLMGYLISKMISRIDNYLVETTLTTVLAYGSYLIAEEVFGVSGVLAVVTAGLVVGNIGPRGMSPTTRIVVFNFWEYAAFLANSFVFLLIGLHTDLNRLMSNWVAIVSAIAAVLAARVVTVYGLSGFSKSVPLKWKGVLFWGGLRGAISLALALSLTAAVPYRDQIQAMAFGVVLFTLLVGGLSMGPLLRGMNLVQTSQMEREYQRRHAQAIAVRSASLRLKHLNDDGLISDYTWDTITPYLRVESRSLTSGVREILEQAPDLHEDEMRNAYREYLRAQRSAYIRLFRDNHINEETFTELIGQIDNQLGSPTLNWPDWGEEAEADAAETPVEGGETGEA